MLRLDRVEIGLRWYYDRAGKKVTSQISQLRNFPKGALRHGVKAEDDELRALGAKTHKLVIRTRALTSQHGERLRQFDDPLNVATGAPASRRPRPRPAPRLDGLPI
jgi:hypothetical protein